MQAGRIITWAMLKGMVMKGNGALRRANVEYAVCRDDRSIGHPVVLLQQRQTHALWREFKIFKGASPNQVKPVRILDVPQKEKFFFGMLEEGSDRSVLEATGSET